MSSLTFSFIRHGATDLNLRGLRCGGDVDVRLTEAGCNTVFDMAHGMLRREMRFGLILCGSLLRIRQTALILSGVLGDLPIITIPELNERRLGDWNGRPIAKTAALLEGNLTPPGGEAEGEFVTRVGEALHQIRHYQDKRALVVSSKGVGRVLYTLLGGQDRLAVDNGELVEFISQVDADGAASVELKRPLSLDPDVPRRVM